MRKYQITVVSVITIFSMLFWMLQNNENEVIESITYFPIHPSAVFLDAKTTITEPVPSSKNGYQFQLKSFSRLENPVYLRQDISLLFADGRLIGKLGKWQEQTDSIQNENVFSLKNNHLLEAMTFHHAEIHNEDQIFSAQTMTNDKLYVIHSSISSVESFRTPLSEEDIGWKEVLDKERQEVLSNSIKNATTKYNIVTEHYHIIPLTDLDNYKEKPLPGFSKQGTKELLGKLWEGLYKNYYLSIKKSDGTLISPLNSTIPVIFLAKNKNHLYVVFDTQDGESVLLYQTIPQ